MPRYGAKSYAVGQASCKRLANVLQDATSQGAGDRWPPVGWMFMERLDRAAAAARQLALRAHCCSEARQGWGQDPVVGGDRTAAPAEIVDLADPGEIPPDYTKVGRRLRRACDKKCRRCGQQSKVPVLHSCSPRVIQFGFALPRPEASPTGGQGDCSIIGKGTGKRHYDLDGMTWAAHAKKAEDAARIGSRKGSPCAR